MRNLRNFVIVFTTCCAIITMFFIFDTNQKPSIPIETVTYTAGRLESPYIFESDNLDEALDMWSQDKTDGYLPFVTRRVYNEKGEIKSERTIYRTLDSVNYVVENGLEISSVELFSEAKSLLKANGNIHRKLWFDDVEPITTLNIVSW